MGGILQPLLMELIQSVIQSGLQELYAEWVGVHAKVALLEGNAICIAHLQASPDVSSLEIVSRAQALHSG